MKLTGPIIIISPPRSRADLLVRMLQSSGIPAANADGLCAKLSTLGDAGSAVWQQAILANLRAASGANPDAETFAIADRLAGHLGWESARHVWTWLLDVLPSLTLVFLTRDHVETLASLEAAWKASIPKYGKCASSCEKNLLSHLESIERFIAENPARCIRVDSGDLTSFTKRPEWITDDGWTNEILVRTHTAETLVEMPPDPDRDGWEDVPFMQVARPAKAVESIIENEITVYTLPVPTTPTARNVEVHTLRYGEADWLLECAPSLDDWCERHGYALKVHPAPIGLPDEKYATVQMMRDFLAGDSELMIFVDADVAVHPLAPGWPADLKGFASRVEFFEKTLSHWERWKSARRIRTDGFGYRNSGVWSCDRESAAQFLTETEGSEWQVSYREQHQFNVWWHRAQQKGMELTALPEEWNILTELERKPAWFFHLNGKNKMRKLWRVRQWKFLPTPPAPFIEDAPTGIPRAICYPWLAESASWEELRYSVRSVLENFTDKECPILILGPTRPKWLLENGRVKFLEIDYSEGNHPGMAAATRKGMQIADEVLWMNDDIYLIQPCGWNDFREAVTEGRIDDRIPRLMASKNGWSRSMAHTAIDLNHYGVGQVMRFATHTPYLFERGKSVEIFRKFSLPYKGAWETLYHGWHGTPHRKIGAMKTNSLESHRILPETIVLNHSEKNLTRDLKIAIEERFPAMAPWESESPAPTAAMPYFGKGAVVWPWNSDLAEWDELHFSAASVAKHFPEKDWPFVIFGDMKPDWWTGEFVHAPSYESAIFAGAQCADQVLLMNDDIFMLADQGPEDFAKARLGGTKTAETLTQSDNLWEQQLGGIILDLESKGLRSINFETHTPYLFERDKMQAAFEIFRPRWKMPLATIYHNLHSTPTAPLTEKAGSLADSSGKLWINPKFEQVTPEFQAEMAARFGDPIKPTA